jgi:outer membrane cobalamin receptor
MVGFFKRQSRGDGTFLDDEAMKRHANRSLSDVLAQVGGVRRSMNSESGDRVTIRGSGRTISTACNVQYYVNGIRSEKGGGSLEALRAADIEGIEVYGGASSIPVEFNSGRAMCGAILIWLKSS